MKPLHKEVAIVFAVHFLVWALGAIAINRFQVGKELSYSIGFWVGSVNFMLLALICRLFLFKKQVALTTGLIVLKYSILALAIYLGLFVFNLPIIWLLAGIGLSVVLVLVEVIWLLRNDDRGLALNGSSF